MKATNDAGGDELGLDELIEAMTHAKAVEDAIHERARPASIAYGRARSDVAAELVLGLLGGDTLDEWRTAAEALGYRRNDGSPGVYDTPEAIGRDLSAWLRFRWATIAPVPPAAASS